MAHHRAFLRGSRCSNSLDGWFGFCSRLSGMSEIHEVGDIQISEDLGFLRREWRFQRIGWFAMLAIILVGLAGGFGRGVLSHESVGDPASFHISYERLLRHGADSKIAVTIGPGLAQDTVRLYVTAEYLHELEVRTITPEPSASGVRGPYVFYDIPRGDRSRASEVVFILNPHTYWSVGARIFAEGTPQLEIRQTILP